MAHAATHTAPNHGRPGALARLFAAGAQAIRNCVLSGRKMRQFDALWALSDAELALRGLKRNQIARYVFAESDWV